MDAIFRYAIDIKLAPFWLPFGVRPAKDGVHLTDDGRFVATYGFLRVETPLDNIGDAHITTVSAGGLRQERACRSSTTD